MNVHNQLVSISLQLQQDIKLTNHKYMAHQLALLYVIILLLLLLLLFNNFLNFRSFFFIYQHCLNQAGGHFIKYKSRVELHFDAIKALTNSSEEPQLTSEQKQWYWYYHFRIHCN